MMHVLTPNKPSHTWSRTHTPWVMRWRYRHAFGTNNVDSKRPRLRFCVLPMRMRRSGLRGMWRIVEDSSRLYKRSWTAQIPRIFDGELRTSLLPTLIDTLSSQALDGTISQVYSEIPFVPGVGIGKAWLNAAPMQISPSRSPSLSDSFSLIPAVPLSLGAEGGLPGRYIVSLLRVFKQFTYTLPGGQIESSFITYSPLWFQCDQWVSWDEIRKEPIKEPTGYFVNEPPGFIHNFDQNVPTMNLSHSLRVLS